jgi:hypothetical protein
VAITAMTSDAGLAPCRRDFPANVRAIRSKSGA